MTNAEKFKALFGIYATELWVMPEAEFLEWLNCEDEPQTCDTCKYGEDKHRYAHICNECGVGINNYEPKGEPQTEVVMPKKCKGCDSASKIIEAYTRGFEDGADAVKAMPQTFVADGIVFAKMDEPQRERSE